MVKGHTQRCIATLFRITSRKPENVLKSLPRRTCIQATDFRFEGCSNWYEAKSPAGSLGVETAHRVHSRKLGIKKKDAWTCKSGR